MTTGIVLAVLLVGTALILCDHRRPHRSRSFHRWQRSLTEISAFQRPPQPTNTDRQQR